MLSCFQNEHPCSVCQGQRLNEALSVKINERNIAEICQLSIDEALRWFSALDLSP